MVKVKGVFEDNAGVLKEFEVSSKSGVTLEISGGDGTICKLQFSCLPSTVATRVKVWGNIKVETDKQQIRTNYAIIKRT